MTTLTSSDTSISEGSVYFDAPLKHFHMNQDDDNGQPRVATHDEAVDQQPEHVEDTSVVYVDGNWVYKPTSEPSSRRTSLKRTKNDTQIERRRTASTNGNGSTRSIRSHAGSGGSTFANGAGTTGPAATPEPDGRLQLRVATADASLTRSQRSKIIKEESECHLPVLDPPE
jgi:hypothetical protein